MKDEDVMRRELWTCGPGDGPGIAGAMGSGVRAASASDELRGLRNEVMESGWTTVVLVEPTSTTRTVLAASLTDRGLRVAPFRDPHLAFLFLLGHLEEVDGVLVNGDDEERASPLLRRLEMLPAPVAVVSYSGRDPDSAAGARGTDGSEATRASAPFRRARAISTGSRLRDPLHHPVDI